MTSRHNLWRVAGIIVVVSVVLVVAGSYRTTPYDPLEFPLQTVYKVTPTEVVIEGALCNLDSKPVEASISLKFASEARGQRGFDILVDSVQDYRPGCEVHHHACSDPGDNGVCPTSVCLNRITLLPAEVTSCHPPFANTFPDELLADLETSPVWRVVGTVTPITPRNGEMAAIQSESFEVVIP